MADLLEDLEAGKGPKTASEVVYYLAHYLTDRVDTLISGIADQLDAVEELVEADERASPDQHQLRTLRRRSAGLRRYLAPQRDIYSQLARYKLSWFVEDDADYWNELNNRLTRNLEELELIRERISVLQEAESRRITERMNRTMYLLGIITGFFLPMSFVTGLLGINVGGIPGADAPHGFWLACLLIGGVAPFSGGYFVGCAGSDVTWGEERASLPRTDMRCACTIRSKSPCGTCSRLRLPSRTTTRVWDGC